MNCDKQDFEVKCPHCENYIIIEQINCAIFRHGILKDSFQQINPHASKEECEIFVTTNKIYGCGKPFRLEKEVAITCDYI